jgi:hypothetical protein
LVLDGLTGDTAEGTCYAIDKTAGRVCDTVKANAAEKVAAAAAALLPLLTRLSSWPAGWRGKLLC